MRVLVVDDEPVARQRLLRLLHQVPDVEVLGEAANAKEALASIGRSRPDVVLLDVEMPGVDGLTLAALPDLPPIIFVTAHASHALEAFSVGAYDYVVKPVDLARLTAALGRVRERTGSASPATEPEPWRLTVTDGALRRFVDAREVACFLAQEKYVSVVVGGRELLLRESLDALEERLAPLGFLRANRGALVRKGAIEAFDARGGGTLVLVGGESVPVSRRALPSIRQALGV